MKLIIASANKHKIEEIRAILSSRFEEIIPAKEAGFFGDVEENGETFSQNALIKAKAVCEALGMPALADDSGLCVDALGGKPGVFSARYCGVHGNDAENNRKLLGEMADKKDRRCRFACAVALCYPDGRYIIGEGAAEGELLYGYDGSGGFGYDPLFFSTELNKSFGKASAEEKNRVSHRAKALCDLLKKL